MPRKKLPRISNRRELFDYLEEQMNRSYRQLQGSGKLENESNFIKTFLLEFDWQPNQLRDSEVNFLANSLTIPATKRKNDTPCVPEISRTSEEGFYLVSWQRSRTTPSHLYLDTITDLGRRFWIGYSLSEATELDAVMNRLSLSQPAFDRVWLWPDFLRKTQQRGEFRGFGLDYDYRKFEIQGGTTDSTNYFKVQLWGGPETEDALDFFSKQNARRTVLSKIRMKYWQDPEERYTHFSVEDLKYDGKLTTRGTSFAAHQTLVSDLREQYSEKIREIEENHVIRATGEEFEDGIAGEPIFFNLGEDRIEDLDSFCEVLFSGYLPFRLWGLPEPTLFGDQGRIVSAVDLHNGGRLSFEIYPDVICMYLYHGACGNSAARFFTNLQHTFSQRVTAEDNSGNSIF